MKQKTPRYHTVPYATTNGQRETWRLLKTKEGPSATFVCQCGLKGLLTSHKIYDDGAVLPSVQCPGCREVQYIKLAGWSVISKSPVFLHGPGEAEG